MELNEKIFEKIIQLCEKGDSLMDKQQFDEAIKQYNAALDLVPEPKGEWETSTWLYSALGDAYFLKGDFPEAGDYFYDAFNCPDGIENPFIILRLGQCLYECGELEKAQNFLMKAFMLEGMDIFEEEDKKYFEAIEELI